MRGCSKVLVNSVKDLKSNWLGTNAQWLEKCESSTAPQVTIQNTEVAPAISNQNLLGAKAIDEPGCWQFALWSKWAPYIANYVASAMRQ
jgi:hypothetical protein